jgi:hypothetical protein
VRKGRKARGDLDDLVAAERHLGSHELVLLREGLRDWKPAMDLLEAFHCAARRHDLSSVRRRQRAGGGGGMGVNLIVEELDYSFGLKELLLRFWGGEI